MHPTEPPRPAKIYFYGVQKIFANSFIWAWILNTAAKYKHPHQATSATMVHETRHPQTSYRRYQTWGNCNYKLQLPHVWYDLSTRGQYYLSRVTMVILATHTDNNCFILLISYHYKFSQSIITLLSSVVLWLRCLWGHQ